MVTLNYFNKSYNFKVEPIISLFVFLNTDIILSMFQIKNLIKRSDFFPPCIINFISTTDSFTIYISTDNFFNCFSKISKQYNYKSVCKANKFCHWYNINYRGYLK